MTELIEASNYHQTRRHYAISMESTRHGQRGVALCSGAVAVDVFGQDYHDTFARRHGFERIDNSTRPLCKRCERKAAKEGLEVPK